MGKRIIRTDGVFEALLGLVLVVGGATGLLDAGDFPTPVGRAVIAATGCVLLLIGVVLWRLAEARVPGPLLRALALANLVTAAAGLVWWIAASGFSTAGSAITLGTTALLALLAAAQLRIAAHAPTAGLAPTPAGRGASRSP
ncbi:MAG TPA: hypothetical protein VEH52_00085 [Gaiellaceae bacterium]|jgi:hypothetical protein|nr:hypothetical protein [Gaiellaceae bacterium]